MAWRPLLPLAMSCRQPQPLSWRLGSSTWTCASLLGGSQRTLGARSVDRDGPNGTPTILQHRLKLTGFPLWFGRFKLHRHLAEKRKSRSKAKNKSSNKAGGGGEGGAEASAGGPLSGEGVEGSSPPRAVQVLQGGGGVGGGRSGGSGGRSPASHQAHPGNGGGSNRGMSPAAAAHTAPQQPKPPKSAQRREKAQAKARLYQQQQQQQLFLPQAQPQKSMSPQARGLPDRLGDFLGN